MLTSMACSVMTLESVVALVRSKIYGKNVRKNIVHCNLIDLQSKKNIVHCNLIDLQSKKNIVHCNLIDLQSKKNIVHCNLIDLQSKKNIVHCNLIDLQSFLITVLDADGMLFPHSSSKSEGTRFCNKLKKGDRKRNHNPEDQSEVYGKNFVAKNSSKIHFNKACIKAGLSVGGGGRGRGKALACIDTPPCSHLEATNFPPSKKHFPCGEQHLNLTAAVILEWCRGIVVKHADSQHRGCQFDSSMCHF